MQDPVVEAAAGVAFQAAPGMPADGEQLQLPPPLKCPRCDSANTKFCYYNNYNLSQPRHFCKDCRRYWTKGGALRNIPVGGGSRKNSKRSSAASGPDPNPKASSKRPAPPPAPALENSDPKSAPAPAPELCPVPIDPADDRMLEITGSFSSLLQSSGAGGAPFENFLDVLESGPSPGPAAASTPDSGDPTSDPQPQQQPPVENFLGWPGAWPDLSIYTSPVSRFQ